MSFCMVAKKRVNFAKIFLFFFQRKNKCANNNHLDILTSSIHDSDDICQKKQQQYK